MEDQLKQILESLPEKPPRSRLAPYIEFIDELRRLGRTYRDIAAILAEKCQLRVSASTIHDFVRTRGRGKADPRARRPPSPSRPATPMHGDKETVDEGEGRLDAARRRIAVVKQMKTATEPAHQAFEFNPSEPLRLNSSAKKKM